MKKFALVVLVVLLVLSWVSVEAQTNTDHWATRVECEVSTTAPFYTPSTMSDRPLEKDEVILPHPTGGCFEIDLPDRLTVRFPIVGRGWVRLPSKIPMVYNSLTHSVRRVAKCDNKIYAEAPFGGHSVATNPFTHIEKTEVEAPDPTPASRAEDEAPTPIRDSGVREVRKQFRREQRRRDDGDDNQSFLKKHWVTTVVVGVTASIVACITTGCLSQKQKTVVCVGGECLHR